jgi:hypothetical protein
MYIRKSIEQDILVLPASTQMYLTKQWIIHRKGRSFMNRLI